MMVGFLLNYIGISPIQGLIYADVLYGLTAPLLIAMIMHIGNNKKIMKKCTNGWKSNFIASITFILMTVAAVALLYLLWS